MRAENPEQDKVREVVDFIPLDVDTPISTLVFFSHPTFPSFPLPEECMSSSLTGQTVTDSHMRAQE